MPTIESVNTPIIKGFLHLFLMIKITLIWVVNVPKSRFVVTQWIRGVHLQGGGSPLRVRHGFVSALHSPQLCESCNFSSLNFSKCPQVKIQTKKKGFIASYLSRDLPPLQFSSNVFLVFYQLSNASKVKNVCMCTHILSLTHTHSRIFSSFKQKRLYGHLVFQILQFCIEIHKLKFSKNYTKGVSRITLAKFNQMARINLILTHKCHLSKKTNYGTLYSKRNSSQRFQ